LRGQAPAFEAEPITPDPQLVHRLQKIFEIDRLALTG
jgi:hypothetical protein